MAQILLFGTQSNPEGSGQQLPHDDVSIGVRGFLLGDSCRVEFCSGELAPPGSLQKPKQAESPRTRSADRCRIFPEIEEPLNGEGQEVKES